MKEKYNEIINFLKQYQEETNVKGYVLGVSGGKDSTVVAKLLVDAIGKENVLGVLMPNDIQNDIADSIRVCNELGIQYQTRNIRYYYEPFTKDYLGFSNAAKINIAPRLRMIVLYAIAQTLGYRVAGTGNKSEQFIGWCTKWGDMACDINPIAHLTCTEVIALGDYMGLPYDLVHKAPADGLTDKSDEENFGFSYKELDGYITERQYWGSVDYNTYLEPMRIDQMIEQKHKGSRHKFAPITIKDYAPRFN